MRWPAFKFCALNLLAVLLLTGCITAKTARLREQAYRQQWQTILADQRPLDQVLSPKALTYLQTLASNKFQCTLPMEYLETGVNFFIVPATLLEDAGPIRERPPVGGLVPAAQEPTKQGQIFKEIAFAGRDNQMRDFAVFISRERSRNDPRLIEAIALHELIHLVEIRSGKSFRDGTDLSFEEYQGVERDAFFYTYSYLKKHQGWEFEDWMGAIEGYRWQMKVAPRWLKFYREIWDSIP